MTQRWHYATLNRSEGRLGGPWCGQANANRTTDPADVTCKRCLKLIAEVEALIAKATTSEVSGE